ncbi:pyridine nucleotide-disulfide oxidoreductase [Aedoeadaptatus coxii]|uniref:NAD(P)/FAD-dependent oxidoreductase n=1 Tax=Aedoeadaptatus coxii TaxID=755172 RepID=UPI00175B78A4|nr:NAD(P)/FAD-dependent oxidoreductase [Peptoniphilus coxii]CAC9927919.1 pyridine nucleotide-disulfide oxidoreductase [Peptoniphilus coxii]
MLDIIIIGGGPAGVSAALYAKARGKNILLLEKEAIGGLIGHVSKVSHYATVGKDETGPSFKKKLIDQLNSSEIPYAIEVAKTLKTTNDGFLVVTDKNEYTAKKVICATGVKLKELPIAEDLTKHWAFGHEDSVKGKTVVVNGGSDGACKEALYIAKFAKEVHIVQMQDKLMCIDEFKRQIEAADTIHVHTACSLKDVEMKDGKCTKVLLDNGDVIEGDGVEIYVQIGQVGNTDLVAPYTTVEDGFVVDDIQSKTDGLYFAGDIRKKVVKQVATAVADGCLAGVLACK